MIGLQITNAFHLLRVIAGEELELAARHLEAVGSHPKQMEAEAREAAKGSASGRH